MRSCRGKRPEVGESPEPPSRIAVFAGDCLARATVPGCGMVFSAGGGHGCTKSQYSSSGTGIPEIRASGKSTANLAASGLRPHLYEAPPTERED